MIGKTKEHSQAEVETLVEFKSRVDSLTNGSDRLRASFTDRVCAKLGARILVPQRHTALSPHEMKVRCELTWGAVRRKMLVGKLGK